MAFPERKSPRKNKDDPVFDGRSVDVDHASNKLGTSKKAVREVVRAAKSALSDLILRRLGDRPQADRSPTATSLGLLQAAFGRGPRGGAVNATAAASALAVSPGTIRRWVSGTQKPSVENLTALRTAARRVTSTKRGRKTVTDAFRNSAIGKDALRRGTIIWVYAFQGPPAVEEDNESNYSRDRTIYHHISPDDVKAMLAAYERGGEAGFRDWLNDMGRKYMQGDPWEFTDIYDFGFESR
ncbi:hypothetical protein KL864_31225 [Mycolicibacterium goodii]|uniref:hypothetical protein n=1 Tax=Mycolicibacterium goodii TaxID=134601 RepID=UPI001BDC5D32|nr:hypothetical protein [Mycolicibacterium goodii]MBU8820355.1 hypothetical protein [Mycolicibacterium goodii]